ncbi:phosphoethanolamine transferase [Bathymodiolus septemdierum thioautotrophic gill symbiont]|uniref:Phosphoethanolamine transferase n=1 Tax=endosymbiont of Bathymodiolus septemdierum str. Myojin knoll TaxID=1303921 RepID=A0A0P0URS7_9GAMM|nr:phosphoethanolamine--lipid A transferase [Bathymodiolus septemdierum thioautotrophic gill symbiont]BAS67828.1 phosphoethanolamine transferase [endosymbiont of Bathymodiolus septemdierum str. Myojin knoll]
MSVNRLLLLTCSFIIVFDNFVFWDKLFQRIDFFEASGFGFALGFGALFFAILYVILALFSNKITLKISLTILLLASAIIGYFSKIGVVFDRFMITNIVDNLKENNTKEALELLSMPLIIHLIIFGLVPIVLLWIVKIKRQPFLVESKNRIVTMLIVVVVCIVMIWFNAKYLTYFGRENRDLRYFVNPLYVIDSMHSYVNKTYFASTAEDFKVIGSDAIINDNQRKTVGIFIIGETARADRFALNGYQKDTSPLLSKRPLVNFSNVASCGTSTAYSVPCMFSILSKDNYSPQKADNQSNALDILQKAGVKVIWIDNNSSCKGVCKRIESKNILAENKFDISMLDTLKDTIDKYDSSVLIVLHSLGSHGPRYYRRYPKSFGKFTPVCENTPEKCSNKEVDNAYDNSILYADYLIDSTIQLMQDNYKDSFVFYASDHGESLGEKGVYLHGLPYIIAPKEQTHVPMLAWFSNEKSATIDEPLSHDNISHSLLGLFRVKTNVYNNKLDLF